MIIYIIIGTVLGLIFGQLLYGDIIKENNEKEIENKIELEYYDE